MEIEFDPDKDAFNRGKHGVSLAFGTKPFDDPAHLVITSFRPIDGEDRYKVVGDVGGTLWTAVHVRRRDAGRFISVRRSNEGEERAYRNSRRPQ